MQDVKGLQREIWTGSALLSLQDVYTRRCRIFSDLSHTVTLFDLLKSGKRFTSIIYKSERLRRSFYLQTIRRFTKTRHHNPIKTQTVGNPLYVTQLTVCNLSSNTYKQQLRDFTVQYILFSIHVNVYTYYYTCLFE